MKKIKGIIGKPATLEKYYPRIEEKEIITALKEGNDLRIGAPRRTGKTSILFHLLDNPPQGYFCVYMDTEWIETGNKFFEEAILQITDSDALDEFGKFSVGVISWLKSIASKIKSTPLFELKSDLQERDFMNEFRSFVNEMDLEDKTLVLMVDEFPVMLMNIWQKEGIEKVKHLLQQLRSIRQDPKLGSKIQFIFTGSVSLFSTLKKLGLTEYFNDVPEIKIGPLSEKDGTSLAKGLLLEHNLLLSNESAEYLMKKVKWLAPFYIQIAVKEIRGLGLKQNTEITSAQIDEAFFSMADTVNIYFEPFRARLNKIFKDQELRFALEFINQLSKENKFEKADYHNLSVKWDVTTQMDWILETLDYDGYIHDRDGNGTFIFNSPILQIWWRKYVAR